MVIGTCGFVGTGSSAVSDYLKEFSNTSALDMVEFIITHGPDGLEDLDFQLNEHCVKYTSSVVAIERFRGNIYNYLLRYVDDLDIRNKIIVALEKYIKSITQVSWKGYGAVDSQLFGSTLYRHPSFNMLSRRIGKKIHRMASKHLHKDSRGFPLYEMNVSVQPENFDEYSREFICDIFRACKLDMEKTIVLDQPFNAINPGRSFKFFEDPRAIIVDRDPCDLFLLTKRYFHPLDLALCVPTNNVEQFIQYYGSMRKNMYRAIENNNDRILSIQFEDMVYRYDETRQKINSFCGLKEEDRVHHFFDPGMSIANTQLHKRYPGEEENLEKIRQALPEYLYDFQQYGEVDTSGKMFPNRSPLNK